MNKIKIEMEKDVAEALIFAGNNYKNRVMYLEREGKISKSKLNRIKKDTLFNILKGVDILGLEICNKCKGTGVFNGEVCFNCKNGMD
jgi:hypothetical protein